VDKAPSWRERPLDIEEEMALVAAAMASSFHLARITPLFDLVCLNSPPCRAAMVPLSVNAKRHLLDPRLFQEGLAVWFSRLETSQLFVDDCSIIRAIHVLLLGPPLSARGDFPKHVQLQPPRHGHEDAAEAHEAAESLRSRRLERESEEEMVVRAIRELIIEIYEAHNPSKLEEIDGLFQKYEGVEREMYVRICSKYGVKPEEACMPRARDDQGQDEDDEGRAASRLQHIDRHVPWLKCSSPHALRSLLALREAVAELLGHSVGKPFGALPRGSAAALRTFRRILVGAGSLAELRLQRHHEFGDLIAFRQIPAPLEEPWMNERRRGRKRMQQSTAGDYAASAPARRERWKRDPEGQLLHWLIGELKDLRGHSREIPELNQRLWQHLGDDARSEALWDLAVNRHFIEKHTHILQLIGENSVALRLDYQPSEPSRSRSRSRSGEEDGAWNSNIQQPSTGTGATTPPFRGSVAGVKASKRSKGNEWSPSSSTNPWKIIPNAWAVDDGAWFSGFAPSWSKGKMGTKGAKGVEDAQSWKGLKGNGLSGKGGCWGPAAPSRTSEWQTPGEDAWASARWQNGPARGSQVRPTSAPKKDSAREALAPSRAPPGHATPSAAPLRPTPPSHPPPGMAPVSAAEAPATLRPSRAPLAPTPKSQSAPLAPTPKSQVRRQTGKLAQSGY